jgi:hypothetical protein
MKKIISLAFTTIVLLSACKKEETVNVLPSVSSVTYKADGAAKTIDSAHAVLYTLGVPPFNRMIDVYAYKGGIEVLEFHFKPTVGSYNADGTFSNSWLTYKTGTNFPVDYYNSISGTLNLTLCDTVTKKIEAAFNFTGNNGTANKSISDGSMKVNITQIL